MPRNTNGKAALRGYIEDTQAAVGDTKEQVKTLTEVIMGYTADGRLNKGVALGLASAAGDVTEALVKVMIYSKLSLIKLDDLLAEKEGERK